MNTTRICAKSVVCLLLVFSGTTQSYLFGQPNYRTNTASLIRRNAAATYYGELAYYTPTEVKSSETHSIRPTTRVNRREQRTLGLPFMQIMVQMFEFDASVHTLDSYKTTANDTLRLLGDIPIRVLNFFIKLFQFESNLFTANNDPRESFFEIKQPALVKHVKY